MPESDSEDSEEDEALTDFKCPISHEIMREPVILCNNNIGETYEREQLDQALTSRPNTDPYTNQTFDGAPVIVPNNTVKRLIIEWRERRAASRRPPPFERPERLTQYIVYSRLTRALATLPDLDESERAVGVSVLDACGDNVTPSERWLANRRRDDSVSHFEVRRGQC